MYGPAIDPATLSPADLRNLDRYLGRTIRNQTAIVHGLEHGHVCADTSFGLIDLHGTVPEVSIPREARALEKMRHQRRHLHNSRTRRADLGLTH